MTFLGDKFYLCFNFNIQSMKICYRIKAMMSFYLHEIEQYCELKKVQFCRMKIENGMFTFE